MPPSHSLSFIASLLSSMFPYVPPFFPLSFPPFLTCTPGRASTKANSTASFITRGLRDASKRRGSKSRLEGGKEGENEGR